jgi:hypothetical protein
VRGQQVHDEVGPPEGEAVYEYGCAVQHVFLAMGIVLDPWFVWQGSRWLGSGSV